ncbi:MAG: tRNA (adenosine(37)-N6)-threonylcarbamoyltransferase complex ATPase subunit type 1 TsaE [Bacteroidales bacterium]|nr:tRNA (adenosine(37)-N6)-threonylcarbamoyltransferase complex ATPase subunit type 1 TsaE [Bacteroidales bacterium]MBR5670660.1 tRNA (adenosine(37)-N6)-threonylcarbamoyltransferase complex ATPase subunit type 1 TsaE [Bacteroidales bacterium]
MKTIAIDSLGSIDAAAKEFAAALGENRIVAFYGSMGAGKTTFISALCRYFGVEDDVCSPTFTIVNEYRAADGDSIFHFDFYRIDSLKEAVDIGFEEYLYSGCLCLIEWPEKVEQLLPEETLKVTITATGDESRKIEIEND